MCICSAVRRCLRDLATSPRRHAASISANGLRLLGLSGTLNFVSTAPELRLFRTVLRDSPIQRSISLSDIASRKYQRRMMLKGAMSITP